MVKVRDIMKREVIKITEKETMADAAKIMTNNRVGSLVVVKNFDEPIDMVTESDVTTVVSMGLDPRKVRISDLRKRGVKKRELISVKSSDNVLSVTKLMAKSGVKRVPVIDNGKLKGIIADKEILLISPELIEIMSEKLKNRIGLAPGPGESISGMCEDCGGYSDSLMQMGNRWVCPECGSEE
jgi:CBS domain-containing protein